MQNTRALIEFVQVSSAADHVFNVGNYSSSYSAFVLYIRFFRCQSLFLYYLREVGLKFAAKGFAWGVSEN